MVTASFPTRILNDPLLDTISKFVSGKIDITTFFCIYTQSDDLADYLNIIIDYIADNNIPIKRRTVLIKNVNHNKPFEMPSFVERFINKYVRDLKAIDISDSWRDNPPKAGSYIKTLSYSTAYGAYMIHNIVSDIYFQIDPNLERTERYDSEYEFTLDVLPAYLAGGVSAENYISQYIISKYPVTMKKAERKKLIKDEIKKTFKRECKGYPKWIQSPEWPLGSDGIPMIYIGQKSFGDRSEYYFRDPCTGKILSITQLW